MVRSAWPRIHPYGLADTYSRVSTYTRRRKAQTLVFVRHASREGRSLSRRSRVHLSRPLFFFFSLRLLPFFTSSLFPGNLVSEIVFRQFLPPRNFDEFKSSFVIICAIYLTIDIQVVSLILKELQLRIKERLSQFICCITFIV